MKNSTILIIFGVGIILFFVLRRIFMFERMMLKIIKHEGGYVNDPDDPGGETKYGISKKAFPNVDIKNLTLQQAYDIYKKYYYLPLSIDKIENKNLAMQVFDFGVNAGVSKAKSFLKTALDISAQSGENPLDIFVSMRKQFYTKIATGAKQKYLNGWLKRVDDSFIA